MAKRRADAPGFLPYLDSLVEHLRALVPDALQHFEVEAVHQARVATRRIKAALNLIGPIIHAEHARPFARVGRKVRRSLGPVRDMDVMLAHLDEIKRSSRQPGAVQWLRRHLLKRRDSAREKSARKTPPVEVLARLGTWRAVRRDVIKSGRTAESLLADSLRAQLERFIAQADAVFARRGAEPGRHGDPHQLRIAARLLRYTLELAEAAGHALPRTVLRTFKRMQQALGEWHDYVVLAEQAMQASLDQDLALHDPGMQRRVLVLASYALGRAQRQLDRFCLLWQKHGRALSRAIRKSFDLKPQVNALRTDRDPADSSTPSAPQADATTSRTDV